MRCAAGTTTLAVATGLTAVMALAACGGGGSASGGSAAIPATLPASRPSTEASITPSAGPSITPSTGPSITPSAGPSALPWHTPTPRPTVAPPTPAVTPTAGPSTSPTRVADSTAAPTYLTDNPAILNGNPTYFAVESAKSTTPIDGIPCTGPLPKLGQHFHDHLTLYVNGEQYAIPVAIGIYHPVRLFGNPHTIVGWYNRNPSDPTSCHYDIHVHAGDAVVHVETPSTTQAFYLKEFLDIWGVSKSTTGFWKFSGPTRWFETDENGPPGTHRVREITGVDPATIKLTPHVEFTVEVGTPLVRIPNYIFIDSQL